MKAGNFKKDVIVLGEWPFGTTEVSKQACTYGGRSYENGDRFKEECNTCICGAGQVTCTKKACGKSTAEGENVVYHILYKNITCSSHAISKADRKIDVKR